MKKSTLHTYWIIISVCLLGIIACSIWAKILEYAATVEACATGGRVPGVLVTSDENYNITIENTRNTPISVTQMVAGRSRSPIVCITYTESDGTKTTKNLGHFGSVHAVSIINEKGKGQ